MKTAVDSSRVAKANIEKDLAGNATLFPTLGPASIQPSLLNEGTGNQVAFTSGASVVDSRTVLRRTVDGGGTNVAISNVVDGKIAADRLLKMPDDVQLRQLYVSSISLF